MGAGEAARIFNEVRQGRVYESVIEQVQDAILDGRLKAGDRLPPERELGAMLRTSRGTLREALRVLEQKGLIEIRTGVRGGAFVSESNARQFHDGLGLLIRHRRVSLSDVAEFREGVEGIVTGLAAERATQSAVRRLKALLEEAHARVECKDDDWKSFIEVDNRLHMALAGMAGNPVYETVLRSVHDNIDQYYEALLPRTRATLELNYADLCEIVQAVEERDAARARSLAQAHVRRFTKLMMKGRKHEQRQRHIA
ncbi:MAG TPA: FadR/GntR family transcriptional regulator [Spirochaetia bacterium]|nr:FadR/GntR family transcriptional regulator [Spirochaetia bacterium]